MKQMFSRLAVVSGLILIVAVGVIARVDDKPITKPKKITYAGSVAKILNAHCVECHRDGEVAPFSLIGYDNAKKWAKMAANVTQSGQMPPWKAVDGYGEFAGANRLTPEEKDTLKNWADQGAPRGNAKDEPAPPKAKGEWPIGKPDIILEMPQPFKVPAEGADIYRMFVMKNDQKEDLWVTGMSVKPGNRSVVHHVIAFLDSTGRSSQLEAKADDGQPGYPSFGGPGFLPSGSLGGWAPGNQTRLVPEGTAFKVAPGEKIVLQVHYHPTGKAEVDQTKIGLYTSKVPVTHEMYLKWMLNPLVSIPAGAKEHKISFASRIGDDVKVYGVMPHMHLLGKSMKAWATLPDGTEKPLIHVADWDFNWQLNYLYKEPLRLPKGTVIHMEAIYDNSSDNPFNPSTPPKRVNFGEATTDEMMLLIAAYTIDR